MAEITAEEYAVEHGGEKVLLEWGRANEDPPGSTIYVYREKLQWDCSSCGHSWGAILSNRVKKGQGCPRCKGDKISSSRKMTMAERLGTLADTHPEMVERWHPEKNLPLTMEQLPRNDKGKYWWICSCGNEWEGAISNRVRSNPSEPFTCPPCSYRRGGERNAENAFSRNSALRDTHPELFLQLDRGRNGEELDVDGAALHQQSQVKVFWICPSCDESYQESPARRVNLGYGCNSRPCINARLGKAARLRAVSRVGSLLEKHPVLAGEWDVVRNGEVIPSEVSPTSQHRAMWLCSSCGHYWGAMVRNRAIHGHGCPRCSGRVCTPGVDDFATKRPDLLKRFISFDDDGPEVPLGSVKFRSHRLARWSCSEGHVSVKSFSEMSANAGCASCTTSIGELEVRAFIRGILEDDVPLLFNDRKLLRPREVDVYAPSLGIALEFNGDYWHSDAVLLERNGVDAATYHGMKLERCRAQGVTLLFLWESQWRGEREAMEAALASAFVSGVVDPSLAVLSLG